MEEECEMMNEGVDDFADTMGKGRSGEKRMWKRLGGEIHEEEMLMGSGRNVDGKRSKC